MEKSCNKHTLEVDAFGKSAVTGHRCCVQNLRLFASPYFKNLFCLLMRTVHASSGPAHEDEIRFPPKRGQLLGKLISRGKKKEIKTGEATQAAKSKNISIVYFIAQVKLIEIP